MKYLVWARKRNDESALWFDLPYAYRSLADAQALLEYYQNEWGSTYEYEIHRGGLTATYPKGTRIPCFVGLND